MGCGASRGVDVRPLSPVVPGADAANPTAGTNGPARPATPEPEPAPDPSAAVPDGGVRSSSFTGLQDLPSPASTATPTEPVGGILAEAPVSEPSTPAQLEAPTPRARPKRPPGLPP
eukprot:COSAG06_NODE_16232_length_1012_cov_0.888280_1_plen_115_part_01